MSAEQSSVYSSVLDFLVFIAELTNLTGELLPRHKSPMSGMYLKHSTANWHESNFSAHIELSSITASLQ